MNDIKIGDIITVVDGQDRSYVGEELEVIAIQMPFIKTLRRGDVITLNTNELSVMKLDKEFILAGKELK